jgi:unsaturated rhamnogalacturonyl hydrolase
MWLDGLYMAEPFYAMYAALFAKPDVFDDIANQFAWQHRHTKDAKTGLYFHGWDESLQQRWADPKTGCSPSLWSRSMGWYGMGLVDVLDFFPKDHPRRNELVGYVRELTESLVKFRDEKSHLWYQIMDAGPREGNYFESSASAMFAYILAKSSRNGYVDGKYLDAARETVDALIAQKVTTDAEGNVDLSGTCKSAGLGGTPYRDGSFDYYVHEPLRVNDLKGIGALLLALTETEKGKEK